LTLNFDLVFSFQVLQPCSIFFKRCVALDTNVTVMEMQITDISINISTTIVQMTFQVIEYLSSELAFRVNLVLFCGSFYGQVY
jgi:hypothetical protein